MENNEKQETKYNAESKIDKVASIIICLFKIVITLIIAGITFLVTAFTVSHFQPRGFGVGSLGNLLEVFGYAAVSAIISIILSIIYFVRKGKQLNKENKK